MSIPSIGVKILKKRKDNMDFILSLAEKLISIILSIMTFFTGGFSTQEPTYSPTNPDQLKLNAAVISDTHIAQDEIECRNLLRKGIADINNSAVPTDVFAIVGDNTDNGKPEEFKLFFNELSACKKAMLTIVAMGNHDSWKAENSFNAFYSEYSAFLRQPVTTTYRHFTKNDYHFFTLGTEQKMQNEAYLSEAQLNWINLELSAVSYTDKPVFIFLHQPFNGTNRVNQAWALGILGEQSDQLMAILKHYTDQGMVIVVFSGHLHSGFGYSGVTNDGNLYFVDCPSFGQTPSRGEVIETGTGYVVEGYIGQLIIRARNFVTGQFYDRFTYTIKTNETPIPQEPTTNPGEPSTEPPTQPPVDEPTTEERTTSPVELPVELPPVA